MSLLGWTNIGAVVLLALSLTFGFYERSGWQSEIAARAADTIAAQKALAVAQATDAARSRQLEDEHAAEVAALKERAHARDTAIASAPSTNACVGSPAMRALIDGLRRRTAPRSGQPSTAP